MVENSIPIPTTDTNVTNNHSVPGEIVVFDAAEHPQELELESDPNLQDGEDDEEEDAENSGVSEEEEETEGIEAEYKFQFQGEMDPLSFAEEEDASGLQPYERFERIEHHYEVLAAKKRPALQESLSEMPAKRLRQEEMAGASFEEIMESMNYGMRKRSRKNKKRGRRKGSRNKARPEVSRKLGEATLHYAHGRFEEAICLLNEVILLAPNLSDPYHTLGLIYTAMGNKKKALNFYMIAAHLTPKDSSLWKVLVAQSIEQGDKRQANYCLNKAIIADPNDIDLRFHRASLYIELGEYLKAADSYEQIARLCPDDIEVLEKATQLYTRCGQRERAVCMLEDNLRNHENFSNLSVVDLLASVLMESNAYARALEHIECTQQVCVTGKEIPLHIIIKAGICHVHLGHLEKAEAYFNVLKPENASTHPDLIIDIADSLVTVGHCESALKYYMMLEEDAEKCYASLRKGVHAIEYYYKAVGKLGDSVDARLTLAFLLLEENRDDEAISMLSPPVESEPNIKSWWSNGKIKLKLAQIYKAKGSVESFADVLFPVIRETLFLEALHQKARVKPRLSRSVLSERVKVLDYHQASRAKKLLEKKAAEREAQKAAALAAGIDWNSDDSDDESPQVLQESPLPDFLKEEEHHLLIIDLCKSLSASRRYWDALEIINLCLKLESNTLSVQTKEALQTLGARTALINLGIGHRLQNKHQTVLQGLAFLYNNARLCEGSQEALYNIARAYHHVGLITLAATYYEKVLAIREKDYSVPTLPNDSRDRIDVKKPGYCDLRREAAYNLHLIYKKSGAFDLARQVLKDHVVL
ncbi:general transcription factor 3c polypeptide 3 [Phtheirospermum japonicum]|uniref:General transcription factor 3c polypeptide 3 n=1 Tax=Phtheirospermum japonicum TaxID=374723 RepID=A0A830CPU7_9LAMI|nr:general transcription factor 3c polypeptide 3 [Phtheirospermum japonicum]